MLVGYLNPRGDISLDEQRELLTRAGCDRLVEGPEELKAALKAIGAGDMLVTASLHCAARCVRSLLDFIANVARTGAHFYSLGIDEGWASTTADTTLREAALSIMAFETAVKIREQQRAIAVARSRGIVCGRRPKLSPKEQADALSLYAAGATQAEVARRFNVSPSTVSYLVRKEHSATQAARSAARMAQATKVAQTIAQGAEP